MMIKPTSSNISSVDPDLPFSCPKCFKGFKSAAARGTHERFCRVQKGPSSQPGPSWVDHQNISSKELKPFKKKMLHWLMVRKNYELKRGVAMWKKMKCYYGKNDNELKHRLKLAAGTILPCLKGDHSLCIRHSFVCTDAKDPLLYLLPHQRNIPSLTDEMQKSISESIWSVFQSEKLNRLILGGTLRTTSTVESVHRTIRTPAPKGKPLPRNQTAVLQFGASIAAANGRGISNLTHFRSLGLPVSAHLSMKMRRLDRLRQQNAKRRKTSSHRERKKAIQREKFESHGKSLETKEATLYKKEAFSDDHNYAQTSSRIAG